MFPADGQDGVALLGGYLRNLRAARAADGGAVLLLDAGDTFEGGIASNISEGGLVVDAYNALGYDALAIGNHEFDYGAVDDAPADLGGAPDKRGALKAAVARARFPFLAANLIDAAGRRTCHLSALWSPANFDAPSPPPRHATPLSRVVPAVRPSDFGRNPRITAVLEHERRMRPAEGGLYPWCRATAPSSTSVEYRWSRHGRPGPPTALRAVGGRELLCPRTKRHPAEATTLRSHC